MRRNTKAGAPHADGMQCPCGVRLRFRAGVAAKRCRACGRLHAAGGGPLRAIATCPRCRRDVQVGPDDPSATCAHCGARMALTDSF
ncbi:MAG TPA: hypothetical protein VFH47_05300 [Candidatus Thermoplasmatota archaeon]|nr:hypothetical protein [Candidatus Thermoplasmatota archaeon]